MYPFLFRTFIPIILLLLAGDTFDQRETVLPKGLLYNVLNKLKL